MVSMSIVSLGCRSLLLVDWHYCLTCTGCFQNVPTLVLVALSCPGQTLMSVCFGSNRES